MSDEKKPFGTANEFFGTLAGAILLAVLVVCAASSLWSWWQMGRFRSAVEDAVLKSGGFSELAGAGDWRIDAPDPKVRRVSSADGEYVVMVWRTGNGKYIVEPLTRP